MPLLPPDHVTLPFAATYLLAAILHDNHGHDPDVRAPVPFDACRLTVDRHPPGRAPNGLPLTPRLERHILVSTALRIHAGTGLDKRDPTNLEVSVMFEEGNGRPLYMAEHGLSPVGVTTLELTLAPPVVGCLSRTRLRAGLNARGLAAIGAPLPGSLEVRVTAFEEQLVARYRQVLAEGRLRTVLVDGDGRPVPIPAAHWREDRATAAFVEPSPVLMILDGQEVRGHVCADISALRLEWRAAFAALPASAELAEAEFPASAARVGTAPLLDFALQVARTLGIVNGRGPDGLPIVPGYLEPLILREWKACGNFKEDPTPYRLQVLSALLRNPDEPRGPKAQWSSLGRP